MRTGWRKTIASSTVGWRRIFLLEESWGNACSEQTNTSLLQSDRTVHSLFDWAPDFPCFGMVTEKPVLEKFLFGSNTWQGSRVSSALPWVSYKVGCHLESGTPAVPGTAWLRKRNISYFYEITHQLKSLKKLDPPKQCIFFPHNQIWYFQKPEISISPQFPFEW